MWLLLFMLLLNVNPPVAEVIAVLPVYKIKPLSRKRGVLARPSKCFLLVNKDKE